MTSMTARRAMGASMLLGASVIACTAPTEAPTDGGSAKSPAAVRVEVRTIRRIPFEDRVEATGSLEADSDATLSARASGTLETLTPLGQRVRAGTVVASIDPGIPKSAVGQAEANRVAARANLELARQRHQRQKPLFEEGVISALEFQAIQAEFEQAKAQTAQAEASLAQAKEALENTRIVAPFPGVVDAHFVDKGEQVAPGTPVLRVLDAQTLVVRAGIPERYAADIQQGAAVEVRLPAYGLKPRRGEVRFVATAIDPKSRTFDVEVALDNKDGRLKPEMVARLVVTRARIDDALVVPEDAVLRDEDGQHIFVVEAKNGRSIARRRAVTTRGRASGFVVVDGASDGERVVILGQTKLIDGDFVAFDGDGASSGSSARVETGP